MECVGSRSRGLSLYDGHFHVLDFYPHEEKVNLADNHVFQMISGRIVACFNHTLFAAHSVNSLGFIVFEFNVQALLNADLHLDRIVHLRVGGERVYQDVHLLRHIRQPSLYRYSE